MSAVLTFLARSAFRVIWGEAIAVYNRRQDHKHDLERGGAAGAIRRRPARPEPGGHRPATQAASGRARLGRR